MIFEQLKEDNIIVVLCFEHIKSGWDGVTPKQNYKMSLVMRKPAFCICENKDADQLREADQRLCFRYIDSTIPLLSKYEISKLLPSSMTVQPGFCRTWSETRMFVFS